MTCEQYRKRLAAIEEQGHVLLRLLSIFNTCDRCCISTEPEVKQHWAHVRSLQNLFSLVGLVVFPAGCGS